MAKRVVITGVLVLIAGALLFMRPYLTAQREATALTPAVPPLPPGSLVPATVKPGSQLCIHDVPLSSDGQVARVLTATGGKPGPALAVQAQAPGYSATTNVPAGWKEGALEVPIRPPTQSERGLFCIRNAGSFPFAVMASGVGEKLARPTPYLDSQALQQDVPLVFHRTQTATMPSRAGAIVDHAAVFWPLPAWLLWVLAVLTAIGLPVLALGAMARSAKMEAMAAARRSGPTSSGPGDGH